MITILIVLLILIAIGGLPRWGYTSNYGVSGIIGIVLVVLLILMVMGQVPRPVW